MYNVFYITFQNRIHDRSCKVDFLNVRLKLTIIKEKKIIKYILYLDFSEFSLRRINIKDITNLLFKLRKI